MHKVLTHIWIAKGSLWSRRLAHAFPKQFLWCATRTLQICSYHISNTCVINCLCQAALDLQDSWLRMCAVWPASPHLCMSNWHLPFCSVFPQVQSLIACILMRIRWMCWPCGKHRAPPKEFWFIYCVCTHTLADVCMPQSAYEGSRAICWSCFPPSPCEVQ